MKSKTQLIVIISILFAIGGGLIFYKHMFLGFPLIPNEEENVWSVEAKITFKAEGKPAKVTLAVPGPQTILNILDESHASAGYGFLRSDDKPGQGIARRAVWSQRDVNGKQTIYYRVVVHKAFVENKAGVIPDFSYITLPEYNNLQETAIKNIIKIVSKKSADKTSFAGALLKLFNSKSPSQDVLLILGRDFSSDSKAKAAAGIMNYAGIRTYLIYGLELHGSKTFTRLTPYIVFAENEKYVIFNPMKTQPGTDVPVLAWQRGNNQLLKVEGGVNPNITFSVVKSSRATLGLAQDAAQNKGEALIDFSIYSLPLEQEAAFLMLLMVPVGALVVVIMRSLIGIPTSGTFMPILLALAFASTDLLPGIIMFSIIITLGLVMRTYLSKLDLLLVPRISAVVVVVIIIMAGVTILSHKLGITGGLRAAFFPVIILSWTVERLSIICEEDGGTEAVRLMTGSIFVSIIIYTLMNSEVVRFWLYSYSEVVLIILGCILLLGQYTGYRLSELLRFAPLAKTVKGE